MWTCPNCGREFKRVNQDHYCGKAPATIDEYILRQAPEVQPLLVQLRETIRTAIPEATETIAWSMPTWRKKKVNLIHLSVSKNFISVHVGEEAVAQFSEALKDFDIHKGTIHLKPDREPPLALVAELARWNFDYDL